MSSAQDSFALSRRPALSFFTLHSSFLCGVVLLTYTAAAAAAITVRASERECSEHSPCAPPTAGRHAATVRWAGHSCHQEPAMPAAEAAAAARAAAERAARRSATSPQEGGRPGQQKRGGAHSRQAWRRGEGAGAQAPLPRRRQRERLQQQQQGQQPEGERGRAQPHPRREREARPSGPRLTWAEGQTGPLAPSNQGGVSAGSAPQAARQGGGSQKSSTAEGGKVSGQRAGRASGSPGSRAQEARQLEGSGSEPHRPPPTRTCVTAAGGRAAAGPGGPHHASPHQRRGGLRGSAAEAASGTRRPRQHSERARGQRPAEPLLPGRSAAVGRFGPRGWPAGGRRTSSRSAGPAPRAER